MPGIRGPGRSRPGWPRPWTRTASHRSPPDLLHRPGTSDQKIGLLHQGRARLPRRQQETQARHSSPPPSPHRAPTPSARPTTNANATKTKRLRPSRPHPGPPPYPDPARHNPQRTPPATHNQPRNYPQPLDTPHRGTPSVAPACAAAGRCSASRSHCIYLVDTNPRTLVCANHQFCRWGVRHGFAGSMHSFSGETPASQTISMVVHNVSDHDLDYWRKTMW